MRIIVAFMCSILLACATTPTQTSAQIIEYKTIEEMSAHASCVAVGPVYAQYSVLMHSPWDRKRAAHIHLKDAAYAKAANTVIMTSNNYGTTTDQVQGVAYNCTYGNK